AAPPPSSPSAGPRQPLRAPRPPARSVPDAPPPASPGRSRPAAAPARAPPTVGRPGAAASRSRGRPPPPARAAAARARAGRAWRSSRHPPPPAGAQPPLGEQQHRTHEKEREVMRRIVRVATDFHLCLLELVDLPVDAVQRGFVGRAEVAAPRDVRHRLEQLLV